ncbi:tRNA(Ile)-lysidine synthase [Marinoscillum furvescens DSM 4134]|uniref:tRNA(Ile)-lysidine synthase n=2 Tax=Marinoscillum furvescens TaxID=1026 RepID=A0A3D9KXL7_MARFU|nr:tRNA(Ile)-lysidine synthase [Marinoscillum furvescens DSM 4134]
MYEAFLTFIKAHQMPIEDQKILLAVSGGADSMVMAHLFLQQDIAFGVAHVNYGLRGEDSHGDEALVSSWCADHNISCHIHQVEPEAFLRGDSTQMIARDIRYSFFEKLQHECGYNVVATAHNANDNLETVLLNLTKGTGIRGLVGIAPVKGHVIRPLLFATKQEVYAYAKKEGLSWREDKSNQKNDYQRNLIRNEVVPLLKQINPSLEQTFGQTWERLVGCAEIVKGDADRFPIEMDGNQHKLDVSWVRNDAASGVRLSELLRVYGFSYTDITDLKRSIIANHSGKMFMSATHVINLDRQVLLISKKGDQDLQKTMIADSTGIYKCGKVSFKVSTESGNDLPIHIPPQVGYFDLHKVSFPLEVSPWATGDSFRPLGMKGKKKVSDFMIDTKIPVTLKREVLTMKSAGEIMWIVGHRTDDRFKVTSQTRTMLRIEVTPDA